MNLNALRLFRQVAHHGSFSAAAATVSISQPAVSRAVADLEASLGARLLDRGRPLTLTPAGHRLFAHAETIFAAERQAEIDVRTMTLPPSRFVRLAASATLLHHDLIAPLAQFMMAHPDINIELLSGNLHQTAVALGNGHADLGIIEGLLTGFEHLSTSPWRLQEFVVLAAATHPLAHRTGRIYPPELNAYPFIHRESGSATAGFVAAIREQHGIAPSRDIKAPDTATMIALTATGAGVTIAPAAAAQCAIKQGLLVILALDIGPICRTTQIVRIESETPKEEVRMLQDHIMESARLLLTDAY